MLKSIFRTRRQATKTPAKSRNAKRAFVILAWVVVTILALEPLRTVQGIVMSKAETLMVSMSEPAVSENSVIHGKGNSFIQVLKAPFKAISKLFGRGRKDDNKL